jgi:hypothetical protein
VAHSQSLVSEGGHEDPNGATFRPESVCDRNPVTVEVQLGHITTLRARPGLDLTAMSLTERVPVADEGNRVTGAVWTWQ